jgi:hypothetical protein
MTEPTDAKKRKSGIPTGNAGEYFVMGELLRREYDAQLADRNTKGYDLLVGKPGDKTMRKVQVKTVHLSPWYVNQASFQEGELIDQITIYVLLGKADRKNPKPVRYFVTRNRDLVSEVTGANWKKPEKTGTRFMALKSIERYENNWDLLDSN